MLRISYYVFRISPWNFLTGLQDLERFFYHEGREDHEGFYPDLHGFFYSGVKEINLIDKESS